jgi:hypothetical protein
MQLMTLRIFQTEVARQCEFALQANHGMRGALSPINTKKFFYSLQAFLVASANISKLLWPNPPSKRKCPSCGYQLPTAPPLLPGRGANLRNSLNISSGSALKPRTLRNHFEHFDERIERWANASRRHNFMDSNIGPSISGVDPADFMRNFDPGNWTATFQGAVYPLDPLVTEVKSIYKTAKVESQKPW